MKNYSKLIWAVMFIAGSAVGFVACKAFAPKAVEAEAEAKRPVVLKVDEKLAKAQKRIAGRCRRKSQDWQCGDAVTGPEFVTTGGDRP